jgi:hypothetical protein
MEEPKTAGEPLYDFYKSRIARDSLDAKLIKQCYMPNIGGDFGLLKAEYQKEDSSDPAVKESLDRIDQLKQRQASFKEAAKRTGIYIDGRLMSIADLVDKYEPLRRKERANTPPELDVQEAIDALNHMKRPKASKPVHPAA